MTSPFFLLAAALVAAVLLLLLPLLWRGKKLQGAQRSAVNAAVFRDQLAELDRDREAGTLSDADYEQARRELQRRVLEEAVPETAPAARSTSSKALALTLAVALPVAAAALYLALGEPDALNPRASAPNAMQESDIQEMVAALAARLESNPDDPKGWAMLGRSYRVMGRYADAAKAFERAGSALNESPDLLTEYAEALALAHNGDLSGKPMQLLDQALKVDPQHAYALVLAGTGAFEARDYTAAISYWERVRQQLPPGSEDERSISESIEKARALQSDKAKPAGQP